ncbi:hypothetical protein VSX64_20985 [Aurantimonas sp. C2-6-R+9]|uniref:hypothetical protein n=1 Tax=unclassified Aurantimonas TaxID=2638230 RepID=UPI002E179872|nr:MULTISPECIES: hypothetical protein [unclassified Aurantimonas]MEC5293326.1 hypothetical protein [Aurantimonas sp. C2-3-R2]MEC5383290.1 hypothetical protein [Aurantimonas sp. C2-6-R+9]MEC5414257.1 hypothetical protein [Aurantimonas sp. C2-4-R8]
MSTEITKHQIERMVGMESRGWGDQCPALHRIARRYRMPFGTLDNIRTGRAKRVFSDVRDAIRAAYLDMCAREVRKWQQELAVERAKGHIDDDLETMEREATDLAARIAARQARIGGGQ